MKPIVIYGPQGCGKTANAGRLQRHYGGQIVDEWDGREALPANAVALTNLAPPYAFPVAAVPFEQALLDAGRV